jgi:hypothetical protein
MKSFVKIMAEALFPPLDSAHPDEHHRWRWSVTIVSLSTAIALVIYIALSSGYVSAVYSGFASASDLAQLQSEWREARETDLESRILDTRTKQCTANTTVKHLYSDSLQKLLIQYHKISGRQYPLPSCSDLT